MGMRSVLWQQEEEEEELCNGNVNVNVNVNVNNVKKVMTDEQLEVLRRQISAYATICDQLVQMHNSITAQQDGMRLGNLYCCDPFMTTSSGHKIGSRQRWTPTPTQLQILERIFDQGTGTPSKHKVKEITNELSQHGPISETNVYNWFQNRRARSKRKHSVGVAANTAESEAEGEEESPKGKKSKMENFGPHDKSDTRDENVHVHSPELVDDAYSFDAQLIIGDSMFDIDRGLRFSEGFDHIALFENVPRMDYLLEKMEVPEGFTHYQLGEEFDISG